MKVVKVQGGIGNQLFCLALARSVADLTGARVSLDIASFRGDRQGRRFALADLAERLGLGVVAHPFLAHPLVGRAMRGLRAPTFTFERRAPEDDGELRSLARRGAYFDGYWQDERYIRDGVAIRRALRDSIAAQCGVPPSHQTVIHYRTYTDEPRRERRGTPDSVYFLAALDALKARGELTGDIVLLSDHIPAAREALGALGREITPSEGQGPFEDLALMLAARNLVLSNSSFSWWGGFASDAGFIAYPRRRDFFHYPAPAARFTVL